MTPFLRPVLLLAAAGTPGLCDAQTGERIGTLRECPGGRMDLFDRESNRARWGRKNADGSSELFEIRGNRIGTVGRDCAIRLEWRRGDKQCSPDGGGR